MRIAALLTSVLVFGTGCVASGTPRPGAAHPVSASSVAWMGELCTIADDLRTAVWGSAADPGPGAADALRAGLDSQLAGASDALSTAVDRLNHLPENSPDGGGGAATELAHRLTALRGSVTSGRKTLAALPANATQADLGRVMGGVWPDVAARAARPFDGIPLTDDMRAAATRPSCRTVPGLR